tara:strand:- start:1081907 stop:1082917 length:1011 start_codon:yes stop_codon:yes gene_type:complete
MHAVTNAASNSNDETSPDQQIAGRQSVNDSTSDASDDRSLTNASTTGESENRAPGTSDSENPDAQTAGLPTAGPQAADPEPIRIRYRIRFAKVDLLRWISHRDLARLWERLLRRAALKLSMTEGFHPKPRVAFPSALALGVESLDEVVEIELAEDLSVTELLDRLCSDRQPGLVIHSVHRLPDGFGKAQLRSTDYIISIPDTVDVDKTRQAIARLLSEPTISFTRKNKIVTVSVPEQITDLRIEDRQLFLTLAASATASLRPGDVLENIDAANWTEQGALITRTKVVLLKEFETDDAECVATAADNDPTSTEHRNRPRPSVEDSSGGSSGPNTRKR